MYITGPSGNATYFNGGQLISMCASSQITLCSACTISLKVANTKVNVEYNSVRLCVPINNCSTTSSIIQITDGNAKVGDTLEVRMAQNSRGLFHRTNSGVSTNIALFNPTTYGGIDSYENRTFYFPLKSGTLVTNVTTATMNSVVSSLSTNLNSNLSRINESLSILNNWANEFGLKLLLMNSSIDSKVALTGGYLEANTFDPGIYMVICTYGSKPLTLYGSTNSDSVTRDIGAPIAIIDSSRSRDDLSAVFFNSANNYKIEYKTFSSSTGEIVLSAPFDTRWIVARLQ